MKKVCTIYTTHALLHRLYYLPVICIIIIIYYIISIVYSVNSVNAMAVRVYVVQTQCKTVQKYFKQLFTIAGSHPALKTITMAQTWRQLYAPQIAALIKENEGKPLKELKRILSEANPGQYGHMRKTWANEYMCQLGLSRRNKIEKQSEQQTTLF